VVKNPRFAVGTVILSLIVPKISISGFGGHIAISDCRLLSQSLGNTLFGLAMVENPGLDVGISTLSVVVPVVQLFPVWVAMSLFSVVVRC